jgi:mono/diheme cytochrome c family protein
MMVARPAFRKESTMKYAAMLGKVFVLGAAALWLTAATAAPAPAPGPVVPPPGSAEEGHAVFALHCARCHGDNAGGGPGGPSLRTSVRSMSEAAFAAKVLQRTHWNLPADAGSEDAARDAFVQGVLRLRKDDRAMPAWQSEPEVANAVNSLYLYLATLPQR